MGLLDTVMDLFFSNKHKKFVDAHRAPADKEAFLTTGAILTYVNNHPPQTLLTAPKGNDPASILETMEITHALVARESIASLLEEGDRAALDPSFQSWREGHLDALDAEQAAMCAFAIEIMNDPERQGDLKLAIGAETIQAVHTVAAWDIERAAFWARMAFNLGWIPETEVWGILKQTHTMAQKCFPHWNAYLISFIFGRSLVLSGKRHQDDLTQLWAEGLLLHEPKWGEIWSWHPLKA